MGKVLFGAIENLLISLNQNQLHNYDNRGIFRYIYYLLDTIFMRQINRRKKETIEEVYRYICVYNNVSNQIFYFVPFFCSQILLHVSYCIIIRLLILNIYYSRDRRYINEIDMIELYRDFCFLLPWYWRDFIFTLPNERWSIILFVICPSQGLHSISIITYTTMIYFFPL